MIILISMYMCFDISIILKSMEQRNINEETVSKYVVLLISGVRYGVNIIKTTIAWHVFKNKWSIIAYKVQNNSIARFTFVSKDVNTLFLVS